MRKTLKQYPRATGLITCCLLALGVGVATPRLLYPTAPLIQPDDSSPLNTRTSNQPNNGTLQKGTPDYDTVLPTGKSIKDYGGWTRVSPPNRDPVYAYVDTIGAIPINVSQQRLPKEFADQPDQQIQQLAQGYGANKKLNVGSVVAYIGTSAKGPQSVIIVKDNLLILIKASAAIPDGEWEVYIKSLS